jgi:hypothetical protein
MLTVAFAMGCPSMIGISTLAAIDFFFGTTGFGLILAEMREEHHGTGPATSRRVSWHPSRNFGNGYTVEIRNANNRPLQLTSCRASWMLEPWNESTQSLLSHAARRDRLISTGTTLINTTLIGLALVSVQLFALFRVTEQPALRSFFGVSLVLNWFLISCQWASSFTYSNGFRGVKAPWLTMPAYINTAPIPRNEVANILSSLNWLSQYLQIQATSGIISLLYHGRFDPAAGLALFQISAGTESFKLTQHIDGVSNVTINRVPAALMILSDKQWVGRPVYAAVLSIPTFILVVVSAVIMASLAVDCSIGAQCLLVIWTISPMLILVVRGGPRMV